MKQSDRIVLCHIGNPFLANGRVRIRFDFRQIRHSYLFQVSFEVHTSVNDYSAIQSDPLIFSINITR